MRQGGAAGSGGIGDEVVPDANLVFDRCRELPAPPALVWPWLVQLGKRRAGWYLPGRIERALPEGRRASRRVEPEWQGLAVGDRIPDYGGRREYLEVVRLDPGRALVYRTERRGTPFSWALTLHELDGGRTLVRLRFRGRLRSSGLRRRGLILLGELLDRVTSELMLSGLEERVARAER